MIDFIMFKPCFKCSAEKPLTDFYVHPAMGDGRLNKCKECTKRDVSKNYRANIEHYRNYERERFQRPERKQDVLKHQRTRRFKHPQKDSAHQAVKRAVKSGKLIRPNSCTHCGNIGSVEGHHPDYSKPLDVMWLCFKCHCAEHGQVAA